MTKDIPVKAGFTRDFPDVRLDNSTYEQIEATLDATLWPCTVDGRLLSLATRIVALASKSNNSKLQSDLLDRALLMEQGKAVYCPEIINLAVDRLKYLEDENLSLKAAVFAANAFSASEAQKQTVSIREPALALVSALIEAQPKFDGLNKASQELYGDFYPHQSPIASVIYPSLIALLNAALDGEADYFIHECQSMPDGGSVSIEGKTWPLKTVDHLRKYLEEKNFP